MRETSNNFDIRSRLAYRIQVLSNKMTTWSASTYSKELDIGVQEARVLIVLARLGEVSANEICEFGKMDKGNVSRAINRLVKMENVTEKLNPADKRSVNLKITPCGMKLYYRIKILSDIREKRFISSLSTMERETLPKILDKLELVIDDLLEGSR